MEAFWQQKPGELKVVGGGSPALAGGASVQALLQGLLQPGVIWLSKTALSRARTERALSLMQSLQTPVWPAWDGAMARVFGYGVAAKSFVLSRWPNLFIFRPHKSFRGAEPGRMGRVVLLDSWRVRFRLFPPWRSDFPVRFPGPGDGSERIQAAGSFHFPAGRRSSRAGDPSSSLSQREVTRVAGYRHCPKARGTFVHIYRSQSRPFGAMAQVLFFRGGQVLSGRSSEPASARERVRTVERAGFLAAARGDP